MKIRISLFCLAAVFFACKTPVEKPAAVPVLQPIDEKLFLPLGGELQYVEITSISPGRPVLLFIHGGPGWPQTPQIRYFNAELAQTYTLAVWDQRGAGQSYLKNPKPKNLTLDRIVQDGHELTQWLKKKYNQDKIYLAGYSWGSLTGIRLARSYPADYTAYIGISQVVNLEKGLELSHNWLFEQATQKSDLATLSLLDSLQKPAFYPTLKDRFLKQYELINKYRGTVYNPASEQETAKARKQYDDYKNYDWEQARAASFSALQADFFEENAFETEALSVPILLIEGRHDWNAPAQLALEWFEKLNAPGKKFLWFENSAHAPLEEEPKRFNHVMRALAD